MTIVTESTALIEDNDEDQSDVYNEGIYHKCYKLITSDKWLFYYCGIISSWDDRSWYFLVGIYLVALDTSSLTLAAIYGFLSSGFVILMGSPIGSWIDRTPRLKAAYTVLCFRNFSVLITSVVLCLVFFYYDEVVVENRYPTLKLLAEICLVGFGVVQLFTALANDTIVGRDWLAIFCDGDKFMLSKMTSRFRLLDMISKIISPVIIGQVISLAGKQTAAIVFSVQVLLTLVIYGYILSVIHRRMPRLHYREGEDLDPNGNQEKQDVESIYQEIGSKYDENSDDSTIIMDAPSSFLKFISNSCSKTLGGWHVYFIQEFCVAGFIMGLICMTVLGFDTITIAYALSQGMTESTLSLFNSASAVAGIIGAVAFPYILRCLGSTVPTGCVAIVLELVALIPCLASVWASGSPYGIPPRNVTFIPIITQNNSLTNQIPYPENEWSLSLMLLMGGTVASRVGLWMFDLNICQMLIETVPEIHRGKVNGVQNSLIMLFDMIKYVLVLVFPLPQQFGLLIILSVVTIFCGAIIYFIFAFKKRCRLISQL